MYFIPCTIKLQPEYQHLAKQFSPSINITHPNHNDTTTNYPHLSKYIYQNLHHPPPRILYALITTLSPIIETCNILLSQTPTPDWTTLLLVRLATLQNPPERHIQNTHPYTLFTQSNQKLINPQNSIHKELYEFIEEQNQNINLETLTNKFPYLPEKPLKETLIHKDPIAEYSHPHNSIIDPHHIHKTPIQQI